MVTPFSHHRKLKPAFSSSAVKSHYTVSFQLWSCRSWGILMDIFQSVFHDFHVQPHTLSSLTTGPKRSLLRRCAARCFPPVSSQLSNVPAYFIISSPNSLLTVSSLSFAALGNEGERPGSAWKQTALWVGILGKVFSVCRWSRKYGFTPISEVSFTLGKRVKY